MRADLLELTEAGLYCPAGGFHVDPWRPVPRAVVTHGHADHARPGHGAYLAAAPGAGVLRARLGDIRLDTLPYGERLGIGAVDVSLHPAGHVLGSAQVRIERAGEVWVVSGDYKLAPDPTCAPFEPLRCDVFVTESTFGLPIYRWPEAGRVLEEVQAWWQAARAEGRACVLYAYAFGKAQRVLAGLDPAIGPIVCHGAVESLNDVYRDAGCALPPTLRMPDASARGLLRGALVLAPPSARGSRWLRRVPDHTDGFASGWMRLRGARRRRAVDRGFVLSDHADWPGLLDAVGATGAQRVLATHGHAPVLARWLSERGLRAEVLETRFADEEGDAPARPSGADADA